MYQHTCAWWKAGALSGRAHAAAPSPQVHSHCSTWLAAASKPCALKRNKAALCSCKQQIPVQASKPCVFISNKALGSVLSYKAVPLPLLPAAPFLFLASCLPIMYRLPIMVLMRACTHARRLDMHIYFIGTHTHTHTSAPCRRCVCVCTHTCTRVSALGSSSKCSRRSSNSSSNAAQSSCPLRRHCAHTAACTTHAAAGW